MGTYNLFLDDFREVQDAYHYTKNELYLKQEWEIVRSYDEFVLFISEKYKRGYFIDIVSFDHDLADSHYDHVTGEFPYDTEEKTGYHCAKWLIDFCIDNKLKFPKYKVHSMNPVGKTNIMSIISNFITKY